MNPKFTRPTKTRSDFVKLSFTHLQRNINKPQVPVNCVLFSYLACFFQQNPKPQRIFTTTKHYIPTGFLPSNGSPTAQNRQVTYDHLPQLRVRLVKISAAAGCFGGGGVRVFTISHWRIHGWKWYDFTY